MDVKQNIFQGVRVSRIILLLCLLYCLAGCVTPIVYKYTPQARDSVISFYRNPAVVASMSGVVIKIDGVKAVSLDNAEFADIKIRVGSHDISVSGINGVSDVKSITLKEGENLHFVIRLGQRAFVVVSKSFLLEKTDEYTFGALTQSAERVKVVYRG